MLSVLRANEKDATLNSTSSNFSASNPHAVKPNFSAVKPVSHLSKPNFSASKSLPNVAKPHNVTNASITSLNNSETNPFKFTSVKSVNDNQTEAKMFGSQSSISSKGKI